jgi:hypothetical protein
MRLTPICWRLGKELPMSDGDFIFIARGIMVEYIPGDRSIPQYKLFHQLLL